MKWTSKKVIFTIWILLALVACTEEAESPAPIEEETLTIEITSRSRLETDHNRNYFYRVQALTTVNNLIEYNIQKPEWIEFDEPSLTFSGTPGWGRLNTTFKIRIEASNAVDTAFQEVSVAVVLGEIICSSDFGDPEESAYILPFNEGEGYLLSQSYCPSNPQWGHHQWFAYDFDMPMGTDVIASRSGQVIAALGTNPDGTRECGRENYVFVLHDDGTVMQYVHFRQNGVVVRSGERVEQGQFLGASGDSGCSIGPHTHVALFRERSNYVRQYSMPFNYLNADGPLDSRGGLVQNEYFIAKPI